jgi:hypothetical protein
MNETSRHHHGVGLGDTDPGNELEDTRENPRVYPRAQSLNVVVRPPPTSIERKVIGRIDVLELVIGETVPATEEDSRQTNDESKD